jgi:hypothetical protein
MEVPVGRAQHWAMKRNLLARNALITILGLIAVIGGRGFSQTPVNEVGITVRVVDYVNLPVADLLELEANTRRILGHAGVPVEFIDCLTGGVSSDAEACHSLMGPNDVVLRILQPKLAVEREELGCAIVTSDAGGYITLFVNPAQKRGKVWNLTNGTLLGHAAAHEIGHLLLGPNSHSSTGIMRPTWGTADQEWMVKGFLRFDASQARRMQLALLARSNRRVTIENMDAQAEAKLQSR